MLKKAVFYCRGDFLAPCVVIYLIECDLIKRLLNFPGCLLFSSTAQEVEKREPGNEVAAAVGNKIIVPIEFIVSLRFTICSEKVFARRASSIG